MMAVPNCLRCLVRPSTTSITTSIIPQSQRIVPIFAAPFSTTSAAQKGGPAPKKKNKGPGIPGKGALARAQIGPNGHIRAGKKMQLGKFKKAKNLERGKAPAPGERKAFRKRVLLSNDNALPVTGLEELSAQGLLDASNVGRMVALPNELVDQLRAVEAFKPTQSWGMFRQPSVLLRKESVELAKKMTETAGRGETLKLVISGDKLVGKSMLLLQAISNAYLNNWIVFHVPEGKSLSTYETSLKHSV
jgi:small subunit ribosomal protein S29